MKLVIRDFVVEVRNQPMALGKLISKLFGGDSGVELKEFECGECDSTFDSAKQPKRASCPECLSNDVAVIGTAERTS